MGTAKLEGQGLGEQVVPRRQFPWRESQCSGVERWHAPETQQMPGTSQGFGSQVVPGRQVWAPVPQADWGSIQHEPE
jgi:hypothetical protein